MEFKGTRGNWTRYTAIALSINEPIRHSVYVGTKRIALCYDLFESDKSKNVDIMEAEANALLISKAPEMLEELQETLKDLLCIQGSIYESSKVDSRWQGVYDIIQKQIDRKKQLIKEATEL